jgi:hypothetical protein
MGRPSVNTDHHNWIPAGPPPDVAHDFRSSIDEPGHFKPCLASRSPNGPHHSGEFQRGAARNGSGELRNRGGARRGNGSGAHGGWWDWVHLHVDIVTDAYDKKRGPDHCATKNPAPVCVFPIT